MTRAKSTLIMLTRAKTLSVMTRRIGFAFCLLTTGCHASPSQPTPDPIVPATSTVMGPLCKSGYALFYGRVTDTGAEERLCEVKGDTTKWYFWTKSGQSHEVVGTEVTDVKKVRFKGKSGYTVGYDFTIGMDYKVGFRAAYYENDNVVPVHAAFVLGGQAMTLDLPTLVVRQ